MPRKLKGLENLIRLQKWHVDEKRREVADLQAMLDDLIGRAEALEAEIQREQKIAANDQVTANYGVYAAAAVKRRETLQHSIVEAQGVVDRAHDELTEMFQELKRYEVARDRELRDRAYQERRREQIELDEISIQRHRRSSGGL